MKKRVAVLLSVCLAFSAVACGNTQGKPSLGEDDTAIEESSDAGADQSQADDKGQEEEKGDDAGSGAALRQGLLGDEETYYDPNLVPSVEPYKVAEDFSNVVYADDFAYMFEPDHQYANENAAQLREALIKNNFAVMSVNYDEFFDIYEDNRYVMFPNFITVDSLMHSYHLYFAHVMKHIEKNHLSNDLGNLSVHMFEMAQKDYELLKGSDWEDAAEKNLEFFYIPCLLMGANVAAPLEAGESFEANTKAEYDKIMAAEAIDDCVISGLKEDYSQYKVRGYYEGDDFLERYFRTMMWYGRIPFALDDPEGVRSAILITGLIDRAGEEWSKIYSVTSFFAGASDDPGYYEMSDVLASVYGKVPDAPEVMEDEKGFSDVCEAVKNLELPQINSIPVMEWEENVIPSFRFMGQRFTIDAGIMQNLVYRAVEENADGVRRYLPDTLDVAAALGSEKAMEMLKEKGETDYKGYTENMELAKEHFNNSDPLLWNSSLYSGWLNVLRPLFEVKGEGYPSYMAGDEWTKKNLETFAGSYAELKHDTILYSKQIMAEMGGPDFDPLDDRGYVDPQPVVYSRFVNLSKQTAAGLERLGMLEQEDKDNLERLTEIAQTLLTISEKELQNQLLTDDEYEFIRAYGGYLEHIWQEVNKGQEETPLSSSEAPCPVVADITTDPNGAVLEVGSGYAHIIYVVFPIDGELHIGRGSAYSFYQFTTPLGERYTDEEFKNRISPGHLDDNWDWVENTDILQQPEWTQSYRIDR